MHPVVIGGKRIGVNEQTFIIAEIGINHNGSIGYARKLIDIAVSCGCDAVKFQKRTVSVVYSADELAKPRRVPRDILELAIARGVLTPEAIKRLIESDFEDSTNGDLKLALELTRDEYAEIDSYCRKKNVLWFASPWDEVSVDFLEMFNPPCYKVASASLTDDYLLHSIRARGRPIILSTGMSTLPMIEHAVSVVGEESLVLMHCTSTYPAKLSELNLRGIQTLEKAFPNIPIGFSSHDTGIQPTYAAVAMGACVIEKHITLHKAEMWGSDQAASNNKLELEMLCRIVREFNEARGDGKIVIYDSEKPIAEKLRRNFGQWTVHGKRKN